MAPQLTYVHPRPDFAATAAAASGVLLWLGLQRRQKGLMSPKRQNFEYEKMDNKIILDANTVPRNIQTLSQALLYAICTL